jgi:hypothetical protein
VNNDKPKKEAQSQTCKNSENSALLYCEDCGKEFNRTRYYMAQDRKDALYKWKTRKCDACTDKTVKKAFAIVPNIMRAL